MKATLIPGVIEALRAVMPKLGEWLMQISVTSEISVQKSAVLGADKMRRTWNPKAPRPLVEDPSLKEKKTAQVGRE